MSDKDLNLEKPPHLDPKEFPYYTEDQVKRWLSALPVNISNARRVEAQLNNELDELKHKLKVQMAKYHLEASSNRDALELSNVDDRKAWVETQPEVQELNTAIILKKGELAVAQVTVDRLENWFVSVRKLANMITEELKLQSQAERSYDPSR